MAKFGRQKIKRLTKVNSVDFVNTVFQLYENRELFAIDPGNEACANIMRHHEVETLQPKEGGGWIEASFSPITDNSPAQIIFSSGTEGNPKAIVISHRALANVVSRLNDIMQMDSSVREYIGVPVTYSFGLGRCRAIATAGGRGFIPEKGFNLVEIKSMLEKGEINAISAVPSLWRQLLSKANYLGALGERVRWIEIGSQYMSADEKAQMKVIFPNANIVQHYGLTEASRSVILNISANDNELESIGYIEDQGIEIKLNPEQRIQIRGEHVALGQLVGDEIQGFVDTDGWFTTGDIGKIENGFLYYGGRYDDIVNCGGIKVDPELLQQKINDRLEGQYEVAAAGVPDNNRGEGFFIAVSTPEFNIEQLRELVNSELLALGLNAIDAVSIAYVAKIPRTETGKIRRKKLAAKFNPGHSGSEQTLKNKSLLDIYKHVFPSSRVTRKSTFKSLGGDSLSYVQMSMEIETILGRLPRDWDNTPIGKLEKLPKEKSGFWVPVEASVFLRAVAIICIVISHSGFHLFGGGTFLLFLLIGTNFARFQFQSFVDNDYWPMLTKYLLRLLIPYMALVIVYSIWIGDLDASMVFLYQNLYSVSWTVVFPYWFVQVLVQCLLIIGFLFTLESFRRYMAQHKWNSSVLVLLTLMGMRWVCTHFWMPEGDLDPLHIIIFIWLGWTLYLSESQPEKILTLSLGLLFALYDQGMESTAAWIIIGCFFIPYVDRIKIPRGTDWVVKYISAATFYIFIFNGISIYVTRNILNIDSVVVHFLVAISVSFVMWRMFEHIIEGKLSAIFSKSKLIKATQNC